MRKFDNYWLSNKEWFHWENGHPVINDTAPPEAQESYKHYIEQTIAAEKQMRKEHTMD
ncbi:MAG: hypothetical protein IK130_02025 [Oscillospiraceae bacterium]|nr:hypothetical protein [Oscillospiraceae bacterium]